MKDVAALIEQMENAPQNVRYLDLAKLCDHYFGQPRQKGTSHRVYQTPWAGNPRVNIQKGRAAKAKTYQVKQVLEAIRKLEGK